MLALAGVAGRVGVQLAAAGAVLLVEALAAAVVGIVAGIPRFGRINGCIALAWFCIVVLGCHNFYLIWYFGRVWYGRYGQGLT